MNWSRTLTKRAYADFRYFAPPALYDLNDLNGDGIEDYLDTRSLHYREDRLNLLSILAYSESAHLSFSLSRADTPDFDSTPDRIPGQAAFLQRTDVGSLGFEPQGDGGVTLVAAYPFAERTRCNALLVKERSPFAYWPADAGRDADRLLAHPDSRRGRRARRALVRVDPAVRGVATPCRCIGREFGGHRRPPDHRGGKLLH